MFRWSGVHGAANVGDGGVALEGSEASSEGCLQLRGQKHPQLCDDASCDELVRGHIEGWVPYLDTCRKRPVEEMWRFKKTL